MATTTFAMRLLTGFAGVATLLAIVGLYGVLSLSVGSRMKELAVRKAIGAQRHQIVGLVIGEGSRLIAVGLAPRRRRRADGRPAARVAVVRRETRRSAHADRSRAPRSRSSRCWSASCRRAAPAASNLMEALRQE